MASKSGQQEPEKAEVIEELLDGLDTTLDRVKVLYEQYFLGIQKQPPSYLHTDVERKLRDLAQAQIRNTALRYRFATLQQKFGSYNSYWRRTLRQIENGTYSRNLYKVGRQAARTGAAVPEEILAAMPKRMRDQVVRDREAALALARRREQADDDLLTLADEDIEIDVGDLGAADLGADDLDPAAFVRESSEVRRNALTASGAHRVDETDGEFDVDAFFASVIRDDTDPSVKPPPREGDGRRGRSGRGSSRPPESPVTATSPLELPLKLPAGAASPVAASVPAAASSYDEPEASTIPIDLPLAPPAAPRAAPEPRTPSVRVLARIAPSPRAKVDGPPPAGRTGQAPVAGPPRPAATDDDTAPTSVPDPLRAATAPADAERAEARGARPIPRIAAPRAATQDETSPTSLPTELRAATPPAADGAPSARPIPRIATPRPAPPPDEAGDASSARPIPRIATPKPAPPPDEAGDASGAVPAPWIPSATAKTPVPPRAPAIPAVAPPARPANVAPSQATTPLRVAPGSAAARTAAPVETLAGPFPRIPTPPPVRAAVPIPEPAPSAPAPGPAPVERPPPAPTAPAQRGTGSQPVASAAPPPVPPQRRTPPPMRAVTPPPVQSERPEPRAALPPGMSDADVQALYTKYVKAKQILGEEAEPGIYGKLVKTINAQAPKIMEQYKSKGVDFSVVVKDNQVIIRAKPKP